MGTVNGLNSPHEARAMLTQALCTLKTGPIQAEEMHKRLLQAQAELAKEKKTVEGLRIHVRNLWRCIERLAKKHGWLSSVSLERCSETWATRSSSTTCRRSMPSWSGSSMSVQRSTGSGAGGPPKMPSARMRPKARTMATAHMTTLRTRAAPPPPPRILSRARQTTRAATMGARATGTQGQEAGRGSGGGSLAWASGHTCRAGMPSCSSSSLCVLA
mmetsp:Transcript_4417/g.12819  ORF Transcript_4417/g.12819 Transcript_4417/m.12819 type:complete len:216 (+) Transcript_4417:624-1271(+)